MSSRRSLVASALVCLALGVLHFACIERFGWFRDELYYIACGEHLAWGYVDHPPLVAAMAAASTHLFGPSLAAVRALPVLLGIATTGLSVALAHALGARSLGLVLTALAVALTPTYLFVFHTLSMNAVEPLLWTAFSWLVLAILRQPSRRLHLLLGAVVGVGLLNKHSMGFLVVATALAAVLSGRWRALFTRGTALSAAVAFVIVLPHLWWQLHHGAATLEFYRTAQAEKMLRMAPLELLFAQLTLAGPGNAPLWMAGLASLSLARSEPGGRVVAASYALLLLFILLAGAKAYYLVPAYPALMAAGAAAFERWALRWVSWAAGALVLVVGLGTLPLALPVLGVEQTITWGRRLGLAPPRAERSELGELPQHFADMFGWQELVQTLAKVHRSLPDTERARAQIVVFNYGEAGAVDWLGRPLGLPRALSPHNSYHGWGTPSEDGPVIVLLSPSRGALDLERVFEHVELAAEHDAEHAMPYERHLRIYVCRGWKRPASAYWAEARRFI